MKAYLDCVPCFLSQALEAARMVTDDYNKEREVLLKVMDFLRNADLNRTPPEISREVHRIIRETLAVDDPYRKVKRESNEFGRKLYPKLMEKVRESNDSLLTAVKLAIAGNAIDFGTTQRYDVSKLIDKALGAEIDEESYRKFREDVLIGKRILYLLDNAGEIFFDRILMEVLCEEGKDVVCAVRKGAIINDATIEDAKFAEIDKIAKVIEGEMLAPSAPGFFVKNFSPELREEFERCDVVISKGQGNYEALSNVERRVYFLLLVKCELVARDIGREVGDFVMKVIN